jgi:hypothetical protein
MFAKKGRENLILCCRKWTKITNATVSNARNYGTDSSLRHSELQTGSSCLRVICNSTAAVVSVGV